MLVINEFDNDEFIDSKVSQMGSTMKQNGCYKLIESSEFLIPFIDQPGARATIRIDKVMNDISAIGYLNDFDRIKSIVKRAIPEGTNPMDASQEIHQFIRKSLINQMVEMHEAVK